MLQTTALDSGILLVAAPPLFTALSRLIHVLQIAKRRRQLVLLLLLLVRLICCACIHSPQEEDFVPWRDKREENKKAGGMLPALGSRFDKKQKLGAEDKAQ